jgi:NAD(P)-dependent dehydrogenase (short-subunit alcohol dehydrogenase family)
MAAGSGRPVVLVTGGSRGIGAATARLAAQRGYAVAISYRTDAAAADEVVRDLPGPAIALPADVADESDVARLFAAVDEFGPLRALVNNAGIAPPAARVSDMDGARLTRLFAVNVVGPMLCAREAVRRMSRAAGGPGGAIVNVSSAAARLGSPGEYVDYAASKGALDTFTRGLALEVVEEGIRVNAVRPGFIDTGIHAPGRLDRVLPGIPLGRAGHPDEVAEAILWLLSDAASYTTGAFLEVTGGR